ncbi:MAG TPA: zinc ribbon domain-containing protein, partial [Candidatus Kapabacteria bacterium]|nr:zinc ribbon domain-containing protein [Candidatus Kapabacteria bacterium]
CQSCGMPMSKDPKNGGTEHQLPTCGIFYCRDCAKINSCGSLQTSSLLDSDMLRNRQQKHTAKPLYTIARIFQLSAFFEASVALFSRTKMISFLTLF